jgi:hypothetical protein
MADFLWEPLPRDYAVERFAMGLPKEKARDDPLHRVSRRKQEGGDGGSDDEEEEEEKKSLEEKEVKEDPSRGRVVSDDPLSAMAAGDFDPLGAMGGAGLHALDDAEEDTANPLMSGITQAVVAAEEKGTDGDVVSAIMPGGPGGEAAVAAKKKDKDPWDVAKQEILDTYTVSEKIKVTASFMEEVDNKEDAKTKRLGAADQTQNRLEQLKTKDDDEQFEELSQKEYMQVGFGFGMGGRVGRMGG